MTQDEAGRTVSEHYTYQKAGQPVCEGWTPRYVDLLLLVVYKSWGMGKFATQHDTKYGRAQSIARQRYNLHGEIVERLFITLVKSLEKERQLERNQD